MSVFTRARSRRSFLKSSATIGAAGLAAMDPMARALAQAGGREPTKVLDFTTYADVAKAEQEGALVFYCHENEAGTAAIAGGFAKDFPRIKATYFRAQTGALYAKIMAERQAGSFNADAIQFSDMSAALDFQNAGGYAIYHSPEAVNYKPEYLSTPAGAFFWVAATFAGMAYNTKLVKPEDAPKAWADISNPKFRGHISCKIVSSGTQYAEWYILRQLYGDGFWKKFANQQPHAFDSRVQVFDRLSKGDDWVTATAEIAAYALFKSKGAPIEYVIPEAGLPASPTLTGVVDKAPHPEAARLFVDWCMSKRGQAYMQEQPNLIYGSVRPDVPPIPALGKRLADYKLLFAKDWKDFQNQHQTFVDEWNGMLGL